MVDTKLDSKNESEVGCSMMSIVHMVGAGTEIEVHTVRFTAARKWTAKEIGKIFREKADMYAQDLPGVQTFSIMAFYGDNTVEPQARRPYVVSKENDFGGLTTEGPTGSGLVQQAMRHSEATMQMCLRQMATMTEQMNYTMGRLADTNRELHSELSDAYVIVRDMVTEKNDRTHKHRIEELKQANFNEMLRKAMNMAPAIVNTITGSEVFPESTEDSSLIEALAEHITPEQLQKMQGLLPPHILAPLVKRFADIVERKDAAKTDYKKMMAGKDPSVDLQ